MRKKKVCPQKAEPKIIMPIAGTQPSFIVADPLGSYTGVPADRLEIPVQDADDL